MYNFEIINIINRSDNNNQNSKYGNYTYNILFVCHPALKTNNAKFKIMILFFDY